MMRKRRARPAARRQVSPAVDIVVASPLWATQRSIKRLLRRAIGEAASVTSTAVGELAIVLTDDSAIRTLNRDWRSRDAATNVLSFPTPETDHPHGTPRLLGDIVIAYETTEREARAENKPFAHHAAHLAVHGFLHLAGTITPRTSKRPQWKTLKQQSLLASTCPILTLRAVRPSLHV